MTRIGVLGQASIDNARMNAHEDSDLLPWILTGLALLIMGTAIGMYSDPSRPDNPPTRSRTAPAAASSPQPPSPPPVMVEQSPAAGAPQS